MLDEFYPGSKKRRNITVEKPPTKDVSSWDYKSYTKIVGGKHLEMYTLGALAKALERPIPTLRMWMQRSYIPNTPYRLPSVEIGGVKRKNRRLYTREMVESAREAFGKRNLLGSARIEWSNHQDLRVELFESWARLTAITNT